MIKNSNIDYTCKRGDELFKRLNTQLANELLPVILNINNQEKKFLLLAQHVFLNFNYIYYKAKQRNLNCLLPIHKTIEELNKKTQYSLTYLSDLFKISSIYKENYFKMQNLPKSLAYHVLSRLRNNVENTTISQCLNKFETNSIASNALIIPYANMNTYNTSAFDIYTTCGDSTITSLYYTATDCPFMVLVTNNIEIQIINYQSLKLIGSIKFQFEPHKKLIFPIFIRKPNYSCQRLAYIQGLIIYESENIIYKISLTDSKQTQVKAYQQSEVRNIFVLSVNCILIQFDTFIDVIDLEKNEVVSHKELKTGIKSLITNKQKSSIVTPDFDMVDRCLLLIVDKSNKIEIYNFIKSKQLLNLLFEMPNDGCSQVDECFIDELFYIENIFLYNYNQLFSMFQFGNSDIYVRIGILSKSTNTIKLLNLFNDAQYEIIAFELQINILNIEKFFNNKIIFNSIDDFIYIYDFGKS